MNILNRKLQKVLEDQRYTIALEQTGKPKPQYVIRFCDEWVGSADNVQDATLSAILHQGTRMGLL